MVAGAVWFCGAFFGLVLLLTFYVWFCVASRFPSGLLASGFRVLGFGFGSWLRAPFGFGAFMVLRSFSIFTFTFLAFWMWNCCMATWHRTSVKRQRFLIGLAKLVRTLLTKMVDIKPKP